MKTGILALAAALLFAACSTDAPTDPNGSEPLMKRAHRFRGTVVGTNVRTGLCDVGWQITATAEGDVSHFGASDFEFVDCFVPNSTMTGGTVAGTITLIAANGDEITATGAGTMTVTSFAPFEAICEGDFTITGGTGRFADAEGGGTIYATQEGGWSNEDNVLTLDIDGTIEY